MVAGGSARGRGMSADSGRNLEIEIKLSGAPEALAAAFRDCGGGPARPKRTASAYYDTADGRLWSRGFALRLRPAEDGGGELTLKREAAGALGRGEWTARLAAPAADLALLPPGAPRGEIGVVLPEELAPRFATDVARRKTRFETCGAAVEAVLDTGEVAAGGERRPLAELEFELLSGPVAPMLRAARAAAEAHGLRVETRSKAARARALANGAPPPPRKAARPALRAADPPARAFAAAFAAAAAHVAANVAPAAAGADPEGVHQLRVGLRRLRTLLALLPAGALPGGESLAADARWALRGLGPARDRDVFLAETLPPVMRADPEAPGLARLAERAAGSAREANAGVRRLLDGRRFNLFLIDLLLLAEGEPAVGGDLGAALGPFAGKALRRRRRKLLAAGRGFETLSDARRHGVRIALKKFRYACDAFQALYPPRAAAPYLESAARLQDALGRLNDSVVAPRLAGEIAAGDAEAALGAAVVRGWYVHRLRAVDGRMVAAWRAFAALPPFWRRT